MVWDLGVGIYNRLSRTEYEDGSLHRSCEYGKNAFLSTNVRISYLLPLQFIVL